MDIKENLAKNLIKYRKASNLTQAELAEKLNYSDKAVSKWERGESVPDLYVLKQLADFYEVKIDTLLEEPKKDKIRTFKNLGKRRIIISSCVAGLVWLVAVCCFAFIEIIFPTFINTWIFFVYALPVTTLILFILTSVWGKSIANAVILSLLVWFTILALYLSLIIFIDNPSPNLWELFLIGVPLQGLIVFWLLYKRTKRFK